jgi:hypothetical protein
MKNRFCSILLFVSLLACSAPIIGAWAGTDSYNSAMTYQGKYTPDVLYIRNRNNPNWYRGLNGTYPKGVLCKDALNHFMSDGRWKGHLRRDGSCGSLAEPAEWSVGNRLNFDASSIAR